MEQLAGQSAHEQDGDEDHHQRQVHRQQGETNLAGALQRSRQRRHALVDMPGDVFQHHDGVVHHQPGGDDQRHQRQVVQGKAGQVHHCKGADQGNRHGQRGNQRPARAAEKQPDQQDDQAHGDQQGTFSLGQGGADHRRTVHGDVQFDTARQHRSQQRQLRLDVVDGLDDVGPGLAVDHQQHGFLIIEETTVVAVLHAVFDLSHIGQAQDGAIALADHQIAVLRGVAQLFVGLHLPVALGILHLPLGPAQVGAGDGGPHFVQRQAVVFQLLRLQLHAHCRQRTAADLHLADALHLRQALAEQAVGQVVELALAQLWRGQRNHHDRRLRRVDLAIAGRAAHATGQELLRGIDGALHFTGGGVDIAAQLELQDDPRAALAAAAVHRTDPGDAAQRAFQWCGHGGGHHLRAGTGQAGLYGDGREVHVR